VSRPHPLVTALHRARRERRWSYAGLARRIGVSYESVRAWESGEQCPSLYHLSLWVDALDLEMRLVPVGEGERCAPVPPPPPGPSPEVIRNRRAVLAGALARPDGDVAPCGTYDAYRRHVIRGEEPCGPCWSWHLRSQLDGAA
jgi:transcriptional regulator with XRE-family HTH domain